MVEKYQDLIGRKIGLHYGENVVNTYVITSMEPIEYRKPGLGQMFRCSITWELQSSGTIPIMDFDEKTLNELLEKGQSVCPLMTNLIYVVISEKNENSQEDVVV